MAWRSRLSLGGEFTLRAPRPATLAVVPLTGSGMGSAEFRVVDAKHHGWQTQIDRDVELVAVWEAAFSGPGPGWVSSFWSTRRPSMVITGRTGE